MAKKNGYKPMKYDVHPVAAMLPLLPREEFDELKADIAAKGVLEPVIMKGSTLLDGRNRMNACEELKITPPIHQYKGADEVGLIVSKAAFRRHMNKDQRAAFIAEALAPTLVKEAEERKKSGKSADGEAPTGEAAAILAKEGKVGQHRARQAINLVTHGTKSDVKRVIAGKETLASAAAAVKRKKTGGKAPRKTKVVDKNSKEFVVKRFQRWLDFWSVQAQRVVKPILKEYLSR